MIVRRRTGSTPRHISPDERAAIEAEYRAGESAHVIAARHNRHKSIIFTIGEAAGIVRGKPKSKTLDAPERLPWWSHPPLPHPLAKVLVQVGAPCWRCKGMGWIDRGARCPLCFGRGTQA